MIGKILVIIVSMKLLNKTSWIIILSALAFFIVNGVVSYNIALEEEIESSYKQDKLIVKNLFASQARYLSVIAETLSVDSFVIEAYKKNDPQLLQEHIEPIWKKLKIDKSIHEIHFFKPPAISFENFSNFKSMGKDVAEVRTDLVWVTSSFKESTHVLMCRTYAGYRATEPIVDINGTMLGGLSLGEKIDWIPSVIKEKTGHDSFLVYKHKHTNSLKEKYYKEFMKDKHLFKKFVLADQTLHVSTDELSDIDFEKSIQNVTIGGEEYTLFSYPVVDFNEQNLGYLCSITKLEKFHTRFVNFFIKEVILIFLTSFLLLYLNRKAHKRVLKYMKHIKNLTNHIKNRNFTILHDKSMLHDYAGNHSFEKIEKNIIKMGQVLEKQYHTLENENRVKTQQLIEQLYQDELTKYGNRNALLRDLNIHNDAYIALLNIRGFKNINDAFGFKIGNHILKDLASHYQKIIEDSGIAFTEMGLYRISNDEFALINQQTMSIEHFIEFVENIIDTISKVHFFYENIQITLNIYAGICLEKEQKLSKVSVALGQAKENKMKYVIYTKKGDIKKIQMHNIEMTHKISYALQHENIIPFFQAITNKNAEVIKYEALVRMRDEEKILSPFLFLSVAMKSNMYYDITKVMVEKTFAIFQNSDKMFSINLTARDILNEEIVTLIFTKLEKCKNRAKVVFELVESDDLFELKEIEEFLFAIKEKGSKIAIDDFGTGYSNFAYMIKMRPDYLKIDGSLIKNIDTDKVAYNMVQTIINFAHDLEIIVVAEFIHSKEVFDICKKLGVDEFQGYYLGEPQEKVL